LERHINLVWGLAQPALLDSPGAHHRQPWSPPVGQPWSPPVGQPWSPPVGQPWSPPWTALRPPVGQPW